MTDTDKLTKVRDMWLRQAETLGAWIQENPLVIAHVRHAVLDAQSNAIAYAKDAQRLIDLHASITA